MKTLRRRVAQRFARRESPWKEILAAGVPARENRAAGKRVLFVSSVGGHAVVRPVDSVVATACWLRGAEVALVLCDGVLPACEACAYTEFPNVTEFIEEGPQGRLCAPCFSDGSAYYEPLPFNTLRYSSYLTPMDREAALTAARPLTLPECFDLRMNGLALGEQVRASTIRFFGKADLTSESPKVVLATARRYAAGALVAARACERLLDEQKPECIVAHHGVYVPQGVLGLVARARGVRVVNWGSSYRNTTAIFSHDDTYHRTFIDEPTTEWADRALTQEEEHELVAYLAARQRGRGDWTWITPESALRPDPRQSMDLLEELSLDPLLPTAGLLTNVLWDAQLFYDAAVFTDMLDWLWTTIDFFRENTDRQLVIRIHPHEIKHGNRQPVEPELRRRYPSLPPTIKIVSHDDAYNTYALMDLCDAVLIYGTKTGVELTAAGIPIVVCGDAWIRGKGLSVDIESREHYSSVLESLPSFERLPPAIVARARKYAHHFFFRRMIPIGAFDPDAAWPPRLRIRSLSELAPGADPGLDTICSGILDSASFVFDAPRT
jgi:hypothetical protein